MKIVPFLSESKDGGCVIFRVEEENKPSVYVWVRPGENGSDKGIKITNLYGVASLFTHAVEPMYALPDGDFDFVDKAMERLKTCPKEALAKKLKRVSDGLEEKMEDERRWKEYCDWEDSAIQAVEEAARNGGGDIMF